MPAKHPALRIFPRKKIGKRRIGLFWADWEQGKRARGILVPSYWKRKVMAISGTALVTVRRFPGPGKAREYAKNQMMVEREIMMMNPKHFVLQPVQFFGIRGNNLAERVYPGPDCKHFSRGEGRYFNALKKRLKRKGIDMATDYRKLSHILYEAMKELQGIGYIMRKKGIGISAIHNNFLVLDFDLEGKKALIAIIDREYPASLPER